MRTKTPHFWPEMKTRRGLGVSWAAISLVDIAADPLQGRSAQTGKLSLLKNATSISGSLATESPNARWRT